ncbi:hypothetical protein [Xylanibacter ruminicola]|uniref:hypothetical protein n=1 Tax=Xylanibacter ruminicola TaxID=839 RepID=UPI0011151235|nr:hypothetical protein [Xylanibacter ruminicola]
MLTMICERGGAVLAAGQLAKGNREKANRIYTVAFVSAMLVTVVLQQAGHVRGTIGHLSLHVYHECYNDSMG